MRYVLLIADGAADAPTEGQTPLMEARLPSFDRLAREGCLGLARTVPPGMDAGSDVANLSIFGYDPQRYYTGRAPLEGAAKGLTLAPGQAVFRANLVTIHDGVMKDYAGGHPGVEEAQALIEDLASALDLPGVALHVGTGYRHLCVCDRMADQIPSCTPPHDILGEATDGYAPTGDSETAARLQAVMDRSREVLATHPFNEKRRERGQAPITQLWLWGGGVMPALPTLHERYGVSGALITAVDLLRGIGRLAGMACIEVPGATGYFDTNYAGKMQAACAALSEHQLVVVHIEAPDEAGHAGSRSEKIRALETIDEVVLAPLLACAEREGDVRILTLPDHPTPLHLRTHTGEPVPYALWGPGLATAPGAGFDEVSAAGRDVVQATDLLGMLTA